MENRNCKDNSPSSSATKAPSLQKEVYNQPASLVTTSTESTIKEISTTASSPLSRCTALPHQRDTLSEAVTSLPLTAAVLCQSVPAKNHTAAGHHSSTYDASALHHPSVDKPLQQRVQTVIERTIIPTMAISLRSGTLQRNDNGLSSSTLPSK